MLDRSRLVNEIFFLGGGRGRVEGQAIFLLCRLQKVFFLHHSLRVSEVLLEPWVPWREIFPWVHDIGMLA